MFKKLCQREAANPDKRTEDAKSGDVLAVKSFQAERRMHSAALSLSNDLSRA